ncbi:putative bifunctional diguanylate cyclase/phosphodiesterase [Acidisoma sp.]|uniref:putative bifunctional diguanylate cyclase/phosphodiesterase n=1 Tax=Acidisoma sp. TaxID=1872115 RepID=UPI003AFF6BDC
MDQSLDPDDVGRGAPPADVADLLQTEALIRTLCRLPIALVAALGVALSVGAFLLCASWEHRIAELNFANSAQAQVSLINTDLQDAASVLDIIRGYYETGEGQVSRGDFLRISGILHGRSVGLRDTGWAPRITMAQRPEFERSVAASGYPGFQILQRDKSGRLVHVGQHAVYYPILYVDPTFREPKVMGFDLMTEPTRAVVIGHAFQTSKAAATPAMALLTAPRPRSGFMSFVPVYIPSGGSEAGRMPAGMIFGVFEISPMIEDIIAVKLRLANIDIYVFDPAGPVGDRLIYWRSGRSHQGSAPAEQALRALPHWEGKVSMFDQKWGVLVLPADGMASSRMTWTGVLPLAAGLLLTAMIVTYLVVSSRRTTQLEILTTSLRRQTEKIVYFARHDSLTELPNRRMFSEVLQHDLDQAAETKTSGALFLIDLDRFKPVNDTHGHLAGDVVLREVANRLRATTLRSATVARLGGDEFAAIVRGHESSGDLAKLARRIIFALSEPILVEAVVVQISASIGVAMYPADASELDALVHAADLAMYSAKRKHGGGFAFFDLTMGMELRSRMSLEADLRQAIANDDIVPYFQPLVRLDDGSVVGAEILARWNHPEQGVIMPENFIPVAESAGLMPAITYNLLRRACVTAAEWPRHMFIALNIAPSHLKDRALPSQLIEILNETNFPPHRLEVELTEAALIAEPELTRSSLVALQNAGVRVALDDFGTGYSSLMHLNRLSFDAIKIDGAIVRSMQEDPASAKIVEAVIGLSKHFSAVTTAEAIETEGVARLLKILGCEFGQGNLYGPAMSSEDIVQFLTNDVLRMALRD